jgi:pimeloyl-ACP methyl ester carboxylesterase
LIIHTIIRVTVVILSEDSYTTIFFLVAMGNAESREVEPATTISTVHEVSASTAAVAQSSRTSSFESFQGDQRSGTPSESESSTIATNRGTFPSTGATGINVEAGGIQRGQEVTEASTSQLGFWYLIKNGYNELVNLIIRPPRAEYEMEELGPTSFNFAGRDFERIDFTVVNQRKQTLQCSQWAPRDPVEGINEFPCVIYLHGNSSCRVEALSILKVCLASGISVVAFDCAGSGKSEGEYISLGYYEREDLKAVVDYLRTNTSVSTIGLWGRSMGAATALLQADGEPSIAGMVLDSAFTGLEELVQEIVEHGRQEGYTIPAFLVKVVMRFIRSSVKQRAHFDIKKLVPIAHTDRSFIPALFVAAKGDTFIAPHHSEQLYESYAGDKNIVKINGDHNSIRPQFLLDSAGIFLQAALRVEPRLFLQGSIPRGRLPWSRGNRTQERAQDMGASLVNNAAAVGSASLEQQVPESPWSCPTCTFLNTQLVFQVKKLIILSQISYNSVELIHLLFS